MGAAIKKFMTESLPVWSLILVIVGAAAILFALLTLVLRRFFFKYEKGEPNPPHIFFIESLILRVISRKVRYELIHEELVRELDGPFIYLLNHHSWLDIAALHRLDPARSFVGVINQHYFSVPVVRTILKKAGHIGKKMFYPDIVCVKNIIRAVRRGYPVALFPEARLSTDGGPSYINASTAALCQKLNVPVVLIQIRNHYFIKPKWRKRVFPGTCEVEVMRVVRPEE